MSEHDHHEDANLGALYRRTQRAEPSQQLDARVLAMAQRHGTRRAHRWWLPLSTAAVVVLTVGLLLRQQQLPDELRPQVPLDLAEQPTASPPLPTPATKAQAQALLSEKAPGYTPARKPPAEDARAVTRNTPVAAPPLQAKLAPVPMAAPEVEGNGTSAPAEAPAVQAAGMAKAEPAPPVADMARAAAVPRGVAPAVEAKSEAKRKESIAEPPDVWLKRIESLRAKGEVEAARRELAAFRKAYPHHTLPKELQPLLPEPAK